MSRLTKWENEHAVLFDYDYEEMNDKFYADNDVVDCVNLEFVLEKLAEYEDLEDKGLLLKLPCPIGTTVYAIYDNKVTKGALIRQSSICFLDDFGKKVFLTKEEAEQKLKEMESDK